MCASGGRALNHIHVRVHQLMYLQFICDENSQRVREDETVDNLDKRFDEQLYGQTMDALFVASNLEGSNGSFLDLARRIVAFPLLFGSLPNGRAPGVFADGLPWWLAVWGFHLLAVCQDKENVFSCETTNGCDEPN